MKIDGNKKGCKGADEAVQEMCVEEAHVEVLEEQRERTLNHQSLGHAAKANK